MGRINNAAQGLHRGRNIYPIDIEYTQLGKKLRQERKRLHYTQEQVAEAIGVTPAFVGHIERGQRSLSLDTLIRMCNFYGVTIDYLLADILPPGKDEITEWFATVIKDKTDDEKAAIVDILNAVFRNI